MTVIGRERRVIFLERLQREDHILRRHRLSVMPFRFGAQPIDHMGKIRRMADGLREETVLGRDLVRSRRDQRVVGLIEAGCDVPLHPRHNKIEVIERAETAQAHTAALRCIRIDIVETLEAGGIFEIAEQREAVAPFLVVCARDSKTERSSSRSNNNSSSSTAAQQGPAGKLQRNGSQNVAPTIFAELCQFSGASTDGPGHDAAILTRASRANRRTVKATRGSGYFF